MKIIGIEKKSGGTRTIYVPSGEEKSRLKSFCPELMNRSRAMCHHAHAFMNGRSPVTNAASHIGYEYTTTMDIRDFFDNCTENLATKVLTDAEIRECMVDGAARQGLPTSPIIANLIASSMDRAIVRKIRKSGFLIEFTRYADDLCFSYNEIDARLFIVKSIPEIVKRCGFSINESKTRTQCARAGRRIICGISVGEKDIRPPRKTRRKLRAAKHRNPDHPSTRGLAEWCKLKKPRQDKDVDEELEKIAKFWKIKTTRRIPDRAQQEVEDGDFLITGDPVRILGASNWTTGWKTCVSHPNGAYRKTLVAWLKIRGTSIACLLSRKTTTIAGVTRRAMRSRCFVHVLRDGSLLYDRIYGDRESCRLLRKWLEERGYTFARQRDKRFRVVGHAIGKHPYCDSLSVGYGTAKNGKYKGKRVWYLF